MKFIFLFLLSFNLIHCATKTIESQNYSYSKRYYGSYEEIFSLTRKALKDYDVIKDNLSEGVLETDLKPLDKTWGSLNSPSYSKNAQYKLKLHLIKSAFYNRPSVKVVVFKYIENQPDFFSDPLIQPSDGVEEKIILYRIQREMIIKKSIQDYERKLQKNNKAKEKKKAKSYNEEKSLYSDEELTNTDADKNPL